MAWHGQSEYAHKSQFQALTRDQRARWRFLADARRSRKQITPADHDVAGALLKHLAEDGRCDPSHARLARLARCCERTVRRSLARLAACGLVQWTRRLVRTRDGAKQTSSAYRLTLADLETPIGATKPGGQPGRGTRNIDLSRAQSAAAAAAAMLDQLQPTKSLAQIARERTQARAAAWLRARMA